MLFMPDVLPYSVAPYRVKNYNQNINLTIVEAYSERKKVSK